MVLVTADEYASCKNTACVYEVDVKLNWRKIVSLRLLRGVGDVSVSAQFGLVFLTLNDLEEDKCRVVVWSIVTGELRYQLTMAFRSS